MTFNSGVSRKQWLQFFGVIMLVLIIPALISNAVMAESDVPVTPPVTSPITPPVSPTPTGTPVIVPTPTASATPIATSTPTASPTFVPSTTPTATPTPTSRPTPTATATPTLRPTPTASGTPTATASATPTPVPAFITVITPNFNQILIKGSVYPITWNTSPNIVYVDILVKDEFGNTKWIVTGLNNPGSYNWTVDTTGLTGNQFKIRLSAYNVNYSVMAIDESDNYFSVATFVPTNTPTASPTPTIRPTPTASGTPTATPTPMPTPSNVAPVISTNLLPLARVGRLYKTLISVYDSNITDNVAVNVSGLPDYTTDLKCTISYSNKGKIYNCIYSGTPRKAGVYIVKVSANDGMGGIANKSLILIVTR